MNGESFKSLMRFIQSRFEEMGTKFREELPLEKVPPSVMPLAHSVLPADDSSLQWSEPGGGISDDPSGTLENIFSRMVTRYDATMCFSPATHATVAIAITAAYTLCAFHHCEKHPG